MSADGQNAPDEITLPARRADRPITAAHYAEFFLLKSLFFMFRIIGLTSSSFIAGKFCRYVGPLISAISNRGRDNLRLVFADWDRAQINHTLKDVWENLGRTTGEFAHLTKLTPTAPSTKVEVRGQEKLNAIAAGKGPVIFVSGHLANWELMSIAFHEAGIDYGVVYRAANNPLVDDLIINERAKVMSRRQIPKGPRGARSLVETLKAGRSLAMLVDQKLNDGIEAPFMGHGAMTAPTPARLALKFGVPLVPVSIEREPGPNFTITIHDPIEFTPTGNIDDDTIALTGHVNDAIGSMIRANPGQWLWLHRRWPKTK